MDFSHDSLSGLVPDSGMFSFSKKALWQGIQTYVDHTWALSQFGFRYKPTSRARFLLHSNLGLALGLFSCSLVFTIEAIVKVRGLKNVPDVEPLKMTAFQKLNFGVTMSWNALKKTLSLANNACLALQDIMATFHKSG
jgi:hypothetical protein